MTELEKMQRAKLYIDKLANGIDPVSDTELPGDSALNNIRLSRCFFYVSDILRQVIENGGPAKAVKRAGTAEFELTQRQREEIQFSKEPVTVTKISQSINALIDPASMKKLPVTAITAWLASNGFLTETVCPNGVKKKVPTAQGTYIGLTAETRHCMRGEYTAVLYSEEAQRFVIDNLDAIIKNHGDKTPQS